jgi:epoxyqueuosine reductase
MSVAPSISHEIIARARSYPEIRAGIARLKDVVRAPSYQVVPEGEWSTSLSASQEGSVTEWPSEARSVLVLGLHHPQSDPRLDWWDRGNTNGNRRLMEISQSFQQWLRKEHGLGAYPLPYHVEWGGLFLKDAAVLAGLGVIGKSNLFLHPEWGPRIRLRSLLIEGDLEPDEPVEGFSPCETCDTLCQKVCPQNAFSSGAYHRPSCIAQLDSDVANKVSAGEIDENGTPLLVIKYCRACELACPVGKDAG